MSACASCCLVLRDDLGLCPHHHLVYDDWHVHNRAMCAFFHRGEIAERPPMTAEEFAEFSMRTTTVPAA
jgi:hypothetical protein